MSITWRGADPPAPAPLGPAGWARVVLRGAALLILLLVGLVALLVLRLVEWLIYGVRRPWSPAVPALVCRCALVLLGLRYRRLGAPARQPGALVANHASWLDIFALNAGAPITFVAKNEVASWPVIGPLASSVGTLFITRRARDAAGQAGTFAQRLRAGQRLLFFPEGTSTDGRRVLHFRSSLFAAFFMSDLRGFLIVQPVSVVYRAPVGTDPRFYGWWGDMGFAEHALQVLAAPRQGRVTVIYHSTHAVADFPDRKALAAACEADVRAGLLAEAEDA